MCAREKRRRGSGYAWCRITEGRISEGLLYVERFGLRDTLASFLQAMNTGQEGKRKQRGARKGDQTLADSTSLNTGKREEGL